MLLATSCCTSCALAPGQLVVTWMVGGVMGGYCETGSPKMDTAPISIVIKAITLPNTGRSIKNLESMIHLSAKVLFRVTQDRAPGRGTGSSLVSVGATD